MKTANDGPHDVEELEQKRSRSLEASTNVDDKEDAWQANDSSSSTRASTVQRLEGRIRASRDSMRTLLSAQNERRTAVLILRSPSFGTT